MVSVDVKHHVYLLTLSWYQSSFFPPSLISLTVSVGVKNHGRRRCLILSLSLVELSVGHSSLQFDKEAEEDKNKRT